MSTQGDTTVPCVDCTLPIQMDHADTVDGLEAREDARRADDGWIHTDCYNARCECGAAEGWNCEHRTYEGAIWFWNGTRASLAQCPVRA